MIRIDTDSYQIEGQKYGLPSQKCGMSVFISQKLQLSSIEYYSCDQSPNQLQSRGVSPCIVTDLQALYKPKRESDVVMAPTTVTSLSFAYLSKYFGDVLNKIAISLRLSEPCETHSFSFFPVLGWICIRFSYGCRVVSFVQSCKIRYHLAFLGVALITISLHMMLYCVELTD